MGRHRIIKYDSRFKGEFATLAALQAQHPTAVNGDMATVAGKVYVYNPSGWATDTDYLQPIGTFAASYPASPSLGLYLFAGYDGATIGGVTYNNGDSAFWNGNSWVKVPGKSLVNYYQKPESDAKFETISKMFQINTNYPRLTHLWVDDSQFNRVLSDTTVFTGTVRNVGSGQAYATITAAFSAAASGDIIVIHNDLDIAAESGGYLMLNSVKDVLIKGVSINIKLTISSSSGYFMRLRSTGNIYLQDLILETNLNVNLISHENYSTAKKLVCKNVTFISNSTSTIYYQANNSINDRFVEFTNCSLTKTGGASAIISTVTIGGSQVLINNCTLTLNNCTEKLLNFSTTGNIAIYDSIIINNSATKILQFGSDVATPSNEIGLVDLRGNTIKYGAAVGDHAVLLGRGVVKAFVFNNKVLMNSIDSSIHLGIVDKSRAVNVNDVLIQGNYVISPRPYLMKGNYKSVARYNSFISNHASWEPVGLTNQKADTGITEALSRYSVVEYNNMVTLYDHAILLYSGASSESETISAKTCTFEYNKYYLTSNYLKDENSGLVAWSNRSTFWGNTNDSDGTLLSNNNVPIRLLTI